MSSASSHEMRSNLFSPRLPALHRVLQAFGRIQALTHGAAAQAGTDVRYRQRHLGRVGAGVFRFDANHLAILDNGFQRATATAVDNARSPANGFHIIHGRSNSLTERREREIGQNACSGGGLQKRPRLRPWVQIDMTISCSKNLLVFGISVTLTKRRNFFVADFLGKSRHGTWQTKYFPVSHEQVSAEAMGVS